MPLSELHVLNFTICTLCRIDLAFFIACFEYGSLNLFQNFISIANVSMGSNFATKDTHVVTYDDDICERWISILRYVSKGDLEGHQPTIKYLRCLLGLDDESVRKIQEEIKTGEIVLF